MAEADVEAELSARFAAGKRLEPDVASELRSVMRLYELSAEDLVFKWESFCLRREHDARLVTVAAVRDLKRGIQEELERERHEALVKSERKMKRVAGAGGGKAGAVDVMGLLDSFLPGTPGVKSRQVASSPVGGGDGQAYVGFVFFFGGIMACLTFI